MIKLIKSLFKKKPEPKSNEWPPRVQPYIVRVKNLTKEIKEFYLFGAIDNSELKALPEGIVIECPIETTSYNDLLWTSILNPIKINYMQVVMIREEISWEEKGADFHMINLKWRNAQGTALTRNIRLIYNPNEFTKFLRDIREEIVIDGFTSLATKILPETTMMYYFYPIEKIEK